MYEEDQDTMWMKSTLIPYVSNARDFFETLLDWEVSKCGCFEPLSKLPSPDTSVGCGVKWPEK